MPLLSKAPITFLNRLRWWLPATARWVWELIRFFAPFLVALVICVTVPVLVRLIWPCSAERAMRWIGGLFQLGGVITIVLKLHAAQRQFPQQTLKRILERRPRFRVQNTVISAAEAAMGMATGRARGRVTPGPQATLEQRLVMLEDSYTKLFDEVGGLENEIRRRGDELSNKLHAEAAAREVADKRIEEQLKETAVGSLHLDVWGVLFFILGIIAGTAFPEIAAVFGAASCK